MRISKYKYVDVHCHLYEYSAREIEAFTKNILIFAVADDFESSKLTLKLSEEYENIVPGIGLHPWEIGISINREEIDKTIELISSIKPVMVGEVGIDARFRKHTLDIQKQVFLKILQVTKENNLKPIMNIHALGAWEYVFNLLVKHDISTAIFHWYTGPIHLLKEIETQGYFISINPSASFQKKHRIILEKAPLSIILTESDGPYNYRGHQLSPSLIKYLIEFISKVKEEDVEIVLKQIIGNAKNILNRIKH